MAMRRSVPLFCLVLCTSPFHAQAGPMLYVAPSGDDRWTGALPAPNAARRDGPFRTIEHARDAARRLKGRAAGVTIVLRCGWYLLPRTLALTAADSGRPGAPTVYAAYPGETPIVSGGRRIGGWRRHGAGPLWEARVPKGWYFTRLWVNGALKTRARIPDTDNWARWYKVVAGGPPEPDAPEGMGSRVFAFPPGTMRAWSNPRDIEIDSLPSYRYANFIAPVERVDAAKSTVTLRSMAYYNFAPGDPFRVENAPEALDRPGEWCLNSKTGAVLYWPERGERMDRASVLAPAMTELVRMKGGDSPSTWVHDLTFRGITFTQCDRRRWDEHPAADEANLHALDAAIYLEGTSRCAIEDCRFVDVAGFAARFNLGAVNDRFVGNEVMGAGCGGIQAGGYGPGTKDVNHGHVITHNHIHHSSTDFWHAGAIDVRQSGHNYVAYNLIHDMPYTAITITGAQTGYFKQYHNKGEGIGRAKYNFRWKEIPADNPLTPESVKPYLHGRDNIVEHNVIHDVLRKLPSDGGALYGFSQGLGNVFRSNTVYRAYCLAIYLDSEFDAVLVKDNVVFDSQVPFGGGGARPMMEGNALYEAGNAPDAVRLLGAQLTRMAEESTGPRRSRTDVPDPTAHVRSATARGVRASFRGLQEGDLAGQDGWQEFGTGGGLVVARGTPAGHLTDPGLVATSPDVDSWAALPLDMVLSPQRELALQVDACATDFATPNSSFEVYLNAGAIHGDAAFGPAIVGGAQEGRPNTIGLRADGAGKRTLADFAMVQGHWYRFRLAMQAGSADARLFATDLSAGDPAAHALTFGGSKTVRLRSGDAWSPTFGALDTLVLRLGGSSQVGGITLRNR